MTLLARAYLHNSLNITTLVFIFIALVIPNRIAEITLSALLVLPLEFLLLGLLLLIPGRVGVLLRGLAALLLAVGIIFKIADLAAFQIFARPFNPIFDAYLLVNGMDLLHGAIGKVGAVIAGILLLAASAGFFLLAFRGLERVRKLLYQAPRFYGLLLLLAVVVWIFLALSGGEKTSTRFYDQLASHARDTRNSLVELQTFQQQIAANIDTQPAQDKLFSALKGKDVLLVFIESYGRTVLQSPDFAEHLRPLLQRGSADLAGNGLQARSAYLTSPTVGGISWLAHGTALSGLWIDSQVRYDSLIMSQRQTLNHLFQQAGWRTVAVMPAITLAWPEGNYFGYDQIYAAQDLGYSGKAFNWVTMPDQYTLAAFQALERKPGHTPVMAEMALISSHAPWTPIPHLIEWSAVGDGSVFNTQASSGATPNEVWQDVARIRQQYRASIEYALTTLVSYANTYGDDNLVILAFGDHQPAPLVTGDTDNRDVLVHLIARDRKVMDAVADWQWSEGMLPADDAPVWRMDQVRQRLMDAFSQ